MTTSLLLLPGCEHRLTVRPGRRLGQARVERCDRCVQPDGLRVVPLNYELLRWNVANVDSRYAVVAVGSNANADVLRGKMTRAGAQPVIPLIVAELQNARVSHSAHVGRPGFIPAAPVAEASGACQVVVGLLDREQVGLLDATEPNYVRRWLTSPDFPLLLDDNEWLLGFHLYDSKWGLLADDRGPVALEPQQEVSAWLAREGIAPWSQTDAGAAARALAEEQALRDEARQCFVDRRLVAPSDLEGPVFTGDVYGTTESSWEGLSDLSPTALRASDTSLLERGGEQCVLIHPSDARERGVSKHAEVRCALRPQAPGFIARVLADETQPRGVVGVDQVVRNGLGVEAGEYVELLPVVVPASRVADAVLAKRHYVACRIQTADLASVEQDVALLSPLTMSLLGVQPGARIVLEGVPSGSGRSVPVVRTRAHEAPQEVIDRRTELSGGGPEARFPSSRDALAVYPDLPWIFLDAATRSRLGLGAHRLQPIRVRAARGDQALAEFRELMLLFILAAVGAASIVSTTKWLVTFLAILGGTAALVARARLRRRLGS